MDDIELHPEVAWVLRQVAAADNPEYHDMEAAQARAEHERRSQVLDIDPVELPLVRDLTLPGPAGALSARLYGAADRARPAPLVLWLHGGGHTIGSIACYDSLCRRLCAGTGALLLSLEYRLAPEHRFPSAVDDAFAALNWCVESAPDLDIDAERIALAGDSAGGNLAAVCALLARDAGLPALAHQLLVYPALGAELDLPSHRRFADGFLLTRRAIDWFRDHYLGPDGDPRDWRFAPLLAPDLAGVAPATVIVASHDPLRDEGIAYAERLRACDVSADLVLARGMVHAFWSMGRAVRPALHSIDDAARRLRAAFAQ